MTPAIPALGPAMAKNNQRTTLAWQVATNAVGSDGLKLNIREQVEILSGCSFLTPGFFSGFNRLHDQGIDRHRTNTTWDWCVSRDSINQWLEFNITDPTRVIARIHNNGTVFYPVGANKFRVARQRQRSHRLVECIFEVLRSGVAEW